MQDALSNPGRQPITMLDIVERLERLEAANTRPASPEMEDLLKAHHAMRAEISGIIRVLQVALRGAHPDGYQELLDDTKRLRDECKLHSELALEGSDDRLKFLGMSRGHTSVIDLITKVRP